MVVRAFNSYLFSFTIPRYGIKSKIDVNKGDESKLQFFYLLVHPSVIRINEKHHVLQPWIYKAWVSPWSNVMVLATTSIVVQGFAFIIRFKDKK